MQRKGEKIIPTEQDIIKSNKESFGDAIGATTNVITSQICLQAKFPEDSEEYKVLSYRILCGQHYQQTCIDKAKGIISKPMPKYWYDNNYNRIEENDTPEERAKKLFNQRICADKKPYFFIYNYKTLQKDYNDYIKVSNSLSIRNFNLSIDELSNAENKSKEQENFISYYEKKLPINNSHCIVNDICFEIENAFSLKKKIKMPFNYEILKSNTPYTKAEYYSILEIYNNFNKLCIGTIKEDAGTCNRTVDSTLYEQFWYLCHMTVSDDKKLCDILLDICYSNRNSKRFIWDICGYLIIQNLVERSSGVINIPQVSESGEFSYDGTNYTMKKFNIRRNEDEIIIE